VGVLNIGLQGAGPKLGKGEIAAFSGAGDDARYFQISVPVQPGNSGGALVDVGQRGGRGVGQVERAGGAGHERGVAGERELRGEEQLLVEFPGIRAGSVREAQRAEHEGSEVRGRGEVRRTSGSAGVGVLREG
jgi:hypothetical protein